MKKVKATTKSSFELTNQEIEHLRDLLSVCLPNHPDVTLSQTLAEKMERTSVEDSLWEKVVAECTRRDLPVGDAAPDFVVITVSQPDISVFEIEKEAPSLTPSVFEKVT